MFRKVVVLLLMGSLLFPVQALWAEDPDLEDRVRELEKKLKSYESIMKDTPDPDSGKKEYFQFRYANPGFEMETSDGLFSLKIISRFQLRYTFPNRSDPRSLSDFTTREDASNFEARRIRLKVGGHGYKPWITYYFEVDLQPSRDVDDSSAASSSRLIDARLTVQPYDELGFRVGQWKIDYNRERVDSSGRQQFVERSIVNRVFTLDRQVGVMVQGRLFKETLADMRYWLGIFNGEGRSVNNPDNDHLYMGRVQWNFLGRDLKWRQSDVEFHQKPTGSLAFATAHNNGQCTRWSSSGCGNLSGFASPGASGKQYTIHQYMQEFAFKYQGLSIQEEYHWKTVEDNAAQVSSMRRGMYAQIGYFFHGLVPQIPKELEVAFRYAFVDAPPSSNILQTNEREEFTAGINWFFAGHNNKITVDYSYLTLEDQPTGLSGNDNRVRVQWDVSF